MASHAELRESFTAASAAQYLSPTQDSGRVPVMGVSPHTHRREGTPLASSPDTVTTEAAAVQEAARAAAEAAKQVAEAAAAVKATGSGLTSPNGEAPTTHGQQLRNSSFAGATAHSELRESFTAGGAAAAAASTADVRMGNGSFGVTPPALNPVFSPHAEHRESAAASQMVSGRGTPTQPVSAHGIFTSATAGQSTAANVSVTAADSFLPRYGGSNTGPFGGGSFGNNSSFGGLGRGAGLGLPAPRLGASPFTDTAATTRTSVGSNLNMLSANAPSSGAGSPLSNEHAAWRESFSAGGTAAAAAAAAASASDRRNVSFGTTPHSAHREDGAATLLAPPASSAAGSEGDGALHSSFGHADRSPGTPGMHAHLRESFTGRSTAAAGAVAAAMEREAAERTKRGEAALTLGASPHVDLGSDAEAAAAAAALPSLSTSQPAPVTAHGVLREASFAGSPLGTVGPGSATLAAHLGGSFGSSLMAASAGSSTGGGRPALSAPARGAPQQQRYGGAAGSPPGLRISGGTSLSTSAQAPPPPGLALPRHHQHHHLHSPQGESVGGSSATQQRINPHVLRRESAASGAASLRGGSGDSIAEMAEGTSPSQPQQLPPQPLATAAPSSTEYAT